uniref:Putative secreted salivary protein n=1 Tax=Ixodes scapularis TaxID=6945 RepID=Q4PN27_IXOSC|nr:putative secreted salivary protein [Ixodes scapularis]
MLHVSLLSRVLVGSLLYCLYNAINADETVSDNIVTLPKEVEDVKKLKEPLLDRKSRNRNWWSEWNRTECLPGAGPRGCPGDHSRH